MIVFRTFVACLVLVTSMSAPAIAVEPNEMLEDPVLEARARALGQELRCLVCQGETIEESNADLAKDLRVLVRERLAAGDSDEQVRAFVVERYGAFVLLRPPLQLDTWILWFGPGLVFVAGVFGILALFRSRRGAQEGPPPDLTDEERRRLHELINGK